MSRTAPPSQTVLRLSGALRRRSMCRALARLIPVVALLGFCDGVLPFTAEATTLRRLTLPQLTRESQQIVVGRVESVRSRWNEKKTQIFTDVTVEVLESVKGDTAQRLVLTQLGGEVDGVLVTVPGGPLFVPGEEALLFVWRGARGAARVTGLSQGKFEILRDPESGQRWIQRNAPGMAVGDLRLLRPLARGSRAPRLALEDLLGEVRRAMVDGDSR